MPPEVSVCVPAYRAARFIGTTIESVLTQTMDDFELIIVDDASPDGTADVAAGFGDPRIRLERNTANLGVAGNWNRAVELAAGRYVKVLCDDDILYPDCLAAQVTIMDAHPGVALVAGSRDIIDEDGRVLMGNRGLGGLEGRVEGREAVRTAVKSGTNVFGEPVCVMLRGDLMATCGAFSGLRPYMIDLDYWCRMLRLGSLFAQPGPIGAFRVVGTSLSVQLAGRQSREAIDLFRHLRVEDPQGISSLDVAAGAARAASLAVARTASYRLLPLRHRLDRRGS